jgi:hypothetical protein
MVNVETPAPVMVVGLNVPVTPEGSPLTLRFTTPLNPFWLVIVAVYGTLAPADTV